MAKKKLKEVEPVMGYVYRPINKSSLYVGRKYYLKLETMSKYVLQEIRDKIIVNHRKGLHVGETVEEYAAYRDEMDQWCNKGRLYDRFTEVINEEAVEESRIIATTIMVSLQADNMPAVLFETDEAKESMCLTSFQL